MKNIRRKLSVVLIVILTLMTFLVEYGFATTLLPWVRFKGTYKTTAGIGTGALTLNATVFEMDYENGDILKANVPGIETVYGAKVVLSGATRTGNYSFNGDPLNPDDVTFSIIAPDGYVYFTSNLADSTFTQQGAYYVWMNQWLNANDVATLNLYNVVLRPNGDDGLHPSRYINELAAYLGATNVSGMKMQLYVPPTQNFTTNSSGPITYGLIDGLQSLNAPPVANAGNDIIISTEQVATTTVQGIGVDPDGDEVYCLWMEGLNVLQDWTLAGANGECPLDLSSLSLGTDTHSLILEVFDGLVTSSDDMVLTINNSAPHANAGDDITIISEQVASTTIQGTATDFDTGNTLQCRWTEGASVLQEWTPAGTNGECSLDLSALSLAPGTYSLILEVSDSLVTSSDDMVLTINNSAPHANAGDNMTITSEQVAITTIQGTATDFDGDTLLCRWMEGLNVLQGWTPAGTNGECPLNLSTLSLGTHTLTLEVSDGQTTTSDGMILAIDNSAPHAAPGGAGVYEINSLVILPGDVSDFDGDQLYYAWKEGDNILCFGNIQASTGGNPVILPDCDVSNLDLGSHTISLQVSDGINLPDRKDVIVKVIDTSAPTIAPVASAYIMWPPNHLMVNLAVWANAADNSGSPVTLTAAVTSNELQDGLGDGDIGPDWTEPVIDQANGRIELNLRRERSGRGTGRVYTIAITATDISSNASTTTVNITVPHDMGKK